MFSGQALAPCESSAVARAKRIHFPGGNMWQMPRERYLDSIESAGCVLSPFQAFPWDCPPAEPGSTPGLRGGQGQKPQTEPPWPLGCTLSTGQMAFPSPFLEFCHSLVLTFNSHVWGRTNQSPCSLPLPTEQSRYIPVMQPFSEALRTFDPFSSCFCTKILVTYLRASMYLIFCPVKEMKNAYFQMQSHCEVSVSQEIIQTKSSCTTHVLQANVRSLFPAQDVGIYLFL